MNNRAIAQKNESVGTFVVMLIVVATALAVAAYVGVHDALPMLQHFMSTIAHPRNN